MKNGNANSCRWPPVDQWIAVWGPFSIALIAIVTSHLLDLFTDLSAMRWLWWYAIALAVSIFGASLILYAKIPLYRQRRFFTFGNGALPASRRAFYRWGYRCVTFAVALLLCLLLSRP
jgi:hypothetical protein